MSNTKLVLVDGSSYLYRAYHALPKLTSSRGEATGAIHGVLNMLNKLIAEQSADHLIVVFDAPGKTFRTELFKDYKANRPPMPDDLKEQIDPLLQAISAMGLPIVRINGVEADDVIGTLCRQACENSINTIVSTVDKDIAQLVNDRVCLINSMTGSILDRQGVKNKFGVYPEQIIDWLALVGDTSDNIPGVPKVGAKTAAKWLNKYDNIDKIIENAGEFSGKVGESLRANLKKLKISRQLATIRQNVDLPLNIRELKKGPADKEKLKALYTRLELKRLLSQIDGVEAEQAKPPKPTEKDYPAILTKSALNTWLKKIDGADIVSIDTETTSINYIEAELVGISIAISPGTAAYIPVAHDYPGAPDQLSRDYVLNKLKSFLENPAKKKVGHHLKYDAHILARYGITLDGMAFDSMLESYVFNSVRTRHDMDSVARQYLGVNTIHYEDVAGKGSKQLKFNEIKIDDATAYAAEDADITLRLHEHLWTQLKKVQPLRSVYELIEQPLVPVLLAMEKEGVFLDCEMLNNQSIELANRMLELEKYAYELAGKNFNLGSPKQLQQILFSDLGLPVVRKTPKGQPSTAEDVLQELANDYELPRVILDYRGVSKLKSTYTDKLPKQIAESTGRIHTSYHQAVTATGRLSSTNPNLQNIPIRTPEGRKIRRAFVSPEGKLLLAADYSQIELRIMAHLSRDKGLVDAFTNNQDVHTATASEVFCVSPDEVSSDQRRSAKAINFGLMYGMSAFGLAKQLSISRIEAQNYMDLYFDRYPGVKTFMDDTRIKAREKGYVETEFGRRLYLPEINDRNAQRRQYAERSAINAPMQGTAADIIKLAMIAVQAWLIDNNVPAKMIMQVHDELVFEISESAVDAVRENIVSIMVEAAKLSVPLQVDAGIGRNWDEAH
ncbi:MAG: DNA polymerase I [Woeseia sp.]|nr:DNA polymerase I [Woeseia sp.]